MSSSSSTDTTRSSVREWLAGFVSGPPSDSELVFADPSSSYYDADFYRACCVSDEAVVVAWFFAFSYERLIIVSRLG